MRFLNRYLDEIGLRGVTGMNGVSCVWNCDWKKYAVRVVCLAVTVLLMAYLCVLDCVHASAEEPGIDVYNVLFISSYANSFLTIEDQISGMNSVFDGQSITMDIEFMDARRVSPNGDTAYFYDYLSYKMGNLAPYDAVIAGDDDALVFVMQHSEDLFSGIPVIFLGINDFEIAEEAQAMGYTGVVEKHEVDNTLRIAEKMLPSATQVVCIYDGSRAGHGDGDYFFSLAASFPELTFVGLDASEYSFDQIADQISLMGDETILLFESMNYDMNRDEMTVVEGSAFLAEYSGTPVFRASYGGVGYGLIGGKMISFELQGQVAASMTQQILEGTDPSLIPIAQDSTSEYLFDQTVLDKYGIDNSVLPEDAVILHAKTSFFTQNHTSIILISLIVLCSSLVVAGVIRSNHHLRKLSKELIKRKEELYRAAYSDILTGVPNREHFYLYLENRLTDTFDFGVNNDNRMRVRDNVTLITADMDDFKMINDLHGHNTGDKVLIEIAQDLMTLAKKNGWYLARTGGDEFSILIEEPMDQNTIVKIVQQIKRIYYQRNFAEKIVFYTSASIGIARYPEDTMCIEDLEKNADRALTQAKAAGKNGYVFFDPSMHVRTEQDMIIQNILPEAIARSQFFLMYQPQYGAISKKIVGYEALIRWDEPTLGSVPPSTFIPIAEKAGYILAIGKWVMETACEFAHKINEGKNEYVVISVNVSAIQIMQPDFYESVIEITERKCVSPQWIGLEITETSILKAVNTYEGVLSRLKRKGFHIILDDFGTGYSSLHYLRELPIETIKIDRSFITALGESPDGEGLLRLIIDITHVMNKRVVAEGVETNEQLLFLTENGCDMIQGYIFSCPLQEADIHQSIDNEI